MKIPIKVIQPLTKLTVVATRVSDQIINYFHTHPGIVPIAPVGLVMGLALLCPEVLWATATSGSSETDTSQFATVATQISTWTSGGLGKTMALASFAVGSASGVMRQNLMYAATGIGGAMAMGYGPKVLGDVLSVCF